MQEQAERRLRWAGTGGSALEGLGGAGAAVLAVLGLVGLSPHRMAELATIVLGGALLLEGVVLSAHYAAAREELEPSEAHALTGGLGTELFGGSAAVALGILALAGVEPERLVSVAVIVLGASVVLGGASLAESGRVGGPPLPSAPERRGEEAAAGAGTVETVAGAGAVVLGLLGLVGLSPWTLALVGLAGVGAAVMLGGSAIALRLGTLARRER